MRFLHEQQLLYEAHIVEADLAQDDLQAGSLLGVELFVIEYAPVSIHTLLHNIHRQIVMRHTMYKEYDNGSCTVPLRTPVVLGRPA